jgi:hypothetical protein
MENTTKKMTTYTTYKVKHFKNDNDETEYWVIACSDDDGSQVKLCKMAHWIRHPESVAHAIALSLEKNKSIKLIDLV